MSGSSRFAARRCGIRRAAKTEGASQPRVPRPLDEVERAGEREHLDDRWRGVGGCIVETGNAVAARDRCQPHRHGPRLLRNPRIQLPSTGAPQRERKEHVTQHDGVVLRGALRIAAVGQDLPRQLMREQQAAQIARPIHALRLHRGSAGHQRRRIAEEVIAEQVLLQVPREKANLRGEAWRQ